MYAAVEYDPFIHTAFTEPFHVSYVSALTMMGSLCVSPAWGHIAPRRKLQTWKITRPDALSRQGDMEPLFISDFHSTIATSRLLPAEKLHGLFLSCLLGASTLRTNLEIPYNFPLSVPGYSTGQKTSTWMAYSCHCTTLLIMETISCNKKVILLSGQGPSYLLPYTPQRALGSQRASIRW